MKTIVALALMLISATATAQINRCVDKSGKTVGYGSECPPGTRSEASGVKSSPAPSAQSAPAASEAAKPKSTAEKDADFRKRQMERQEADSKAQKKSAEGDDRKRQCEQAQSYLKSLQENQRITRIDPKTGERSYLADTEYPTEIARAQRSVASNCK